VVQEAHAPVFKLRRATDRYMAVGFVAIAVFMWILEVRLAVRDEWLSALTYLVPLRRIRPSRPAATAERCARRTPWVAGVTSGGRSDSRNDDHLG
jgi:hypothetical protein